MRTVQTCQKSRGIGCVISRCNLQCGITQPILRLFEISVVPATLCNLQELNANALLTVDPCVVNVALLPRRTALTNSTLDDAGCCDSTSIFSPKGAGNTRKSMSMSGALALSCSLRSEIASGQRTNGDLNDKGRSERRAEAFDGAEDSYNVRQKAPGLM